MTARPPAWPTAAPLTTPRLSLEPLRADHAPEAVSVFDDVRLHTWTGGSPRSLAQLEARYARQSAGRSPDGTQGWLNWMARRTSDGLLIGTVQATLDRRPAAEGPPAGDAIEAAVAWVVGVDHQGAGYGREAALAMASWLRAQGVGGLAAYIRPGHGASEGIARALGLRASDVVADGEARWSDSGR
ncbi:GNAT family N-acetyltransferase [Streptomyces sp. NBC_00102]|uniref:GNAT family N-acetyltransferase n=1 Tax=Streptomyces sp. NBC_00102 TaxID=2975652 RepID=UPI0022555EA6|nr:GNAT family N-acetyltransferase [Streptomyces sp. NBC_00102]MCX5400955.1 GNAT family N-acetyltransferase [Streptomyces sp. NBC_00102]